MLRILWRLADYVRAGHYIFPNLASIVADYIEGRDTPFRITTVADLLLKAEVIAKEGDDFHIDILLADLRRITGEG